MKSLAFAAGILVGVFSVSPLFAANDMIGVTWSGSVYQLDSTTGAGSLLASSGFSGLNSQAIDTAGTIHTISKLGEIITINETTGAGTLLGTVSLNVRGLAFDSSNVLYAAVDVAYGSNDLLYTIDLTTMTASQVGSIGLLGIQGLAFDPNGTLYAWDLGTGGTTGTGLVTVSTTTGAYTDVNPAVGSDFAAANMQFLTCSPSGQLYGGASSLFTLDKTTGKWTFVGSGGFSDLRGCDFTGPTSPCPPSWANYGKGFPGTSGIPTLTLSANPVIGTQISLLAGSSATGTELSLLFVGAAQASVPGFWGGTLELVPLVTVAIPMPAAGWTLPFPIPNDPKLCGFTAYLQILQSDIGAAQGAASSPGLAANIGM